jgi:hypothetical protein
MHSDDDNREPESYPDAVGILSRSEKVQPALVEELVQPELSDWVKSFHHKPIHMPSLRRALRERLQEKVEREGISRAEAALLLGMTEGALADLVTRRLPTLPVRKGKKGQELFLKDELNAFVSAYLPNFKTWATRTSLLQEFFRSLESQTGFKPTPQPCEIGGCPELAAVLCANPDCRPPASPRKVCIAHRERLRSEEEKSLCEVCVRRVLYGDLKGHFQIAGTEQRLRKDHPNEQP